MFSRVLSAAIVGLEVYAVQVEADVSDGLPGFSMVGFVTSQVREAQDRVRTALKNNRMSMPPKKITVNLAPANIRKDGAGFDLPIAAAILCASKIIKEESLRDVFIIGELGLNGEIHGVRGVLPMVMSARKWQCRLCIVPAENLEEAAIVEGISVSAVSNLQEFIELLKTGKINASVREKVSESIYEEKGPDFADICGQQMLKRAAVLAVTGFHNMLMIGPPGSGKTMMAQRIAGILPKLTDEESLEITRIYSIAGLLPTNQPLITKRPFRSPHHTTTPKALAGGGVVPHPGEITLAHKGVLFLDELPEFTRASLEILRQPMEDHQVLISRNTGTYCFPAEFLLLAAMNPCPCGYFPDMNRCTCNPGDVSRYQGKISFPLLDRMDICIEAPAITYEELQGQKKKGTTSAQMRQQVEMAREIQKLRYKGTGLAFNAQLKPMQMELFCPMTEGAKKLLEMAYRKLELSARGYHRIIRVARSAADLDGQEVISEVHISEAIQYRSIDRKYWRK